ncbi:MAG: hypothetical protein KGJ80_12420, partial [Chloroflexota bacterium]|nr:hypothetical protein [Chloroflexota bacterium]
TAIGRQVDLEGCVTVPPSVLSDRFIFLQDQTGGIKVYLSSRVGDFPALELNDRVAVRGRTRTSYGEREVDIEDAATVQARGACGAPAALRKIATGAIDKNVEGLLVEVGGRVTSVDRGEFVLDDNSGGVLVYIDQTTRIRLPRLALGQSLRVVGVVSRAHGKSAVLPRYDADLIIPAAATPTPAATAKAAATRAAAPTITGSPRAIAPTTATTTPRAFMRSTPAPAETASTTEAQALAAVGGTTSIAASFVLFALAAMLFKKQPR